MRLECARGRPDTAADSGPSATANLPASASGGGARNRGCGVDGGEGVRGIGELPLAAGGDGAEPGTGLRDGGGAGGGPLLEDEPMSSVLERAADDAGGGGGGGGGTRP